MSDARTERHAIILHLSGWGDLTSEVSRQLTEAGLATETSDDAYLAMGWLAAQQPSPAKRLRVATSRDRSIGLVR